MLSAAVAALALPLQLVAQLDASAAGDASWRALITDDPLHNAVLIFLVLLSLLSWGIMFAKLNEFRRAEKHGFAFLREF